MHYLFEAERPNRGYQIFCTVQSEWYLSVNDSDPIFGMMINLYSFQPRQDCYTKKVKERSRQIRLFIEIV